MALADTAQLVEWWLVNWKVASLIPGQGTCLGGRFRPRLEHMQEAIDWCFSLTSVFYAHSSSLPPFLLISLKTNKYFKTCYFVAKSRFWMYFQLRSNNKNKLSSPTLYKFKLQIVTRWRCSMSRNSRETGKPVFLHLPWYRDSQSQWSILTLNYAKGYYKI